MYYNNELMEMFHTIDESQNTQICEVHQGSWRIATPEKSILATKNLSDCVGILIYDLEKGFAFLSHSDDKSFTNEINHLNRKSKHLLELKKRLEESDEEYHLTVVILPGEYTKPKTIDAIYFTLKELESDTIRIVSVEERIPFEDKSIPGSRTIAFNSKTGEIKPFNHQNDRKKR